MYAYSAHFDTRSVRSVFCDVRATAENDLNSFFAAAKKRCEAFPAGCVHHLPGNSFCGREFLQRCKEKMLDSGEGKEYTQWLSTEIT